METLVVALGVVPFLAGRTSLAICLLLTWYALQGVWATKEFSLRGVLIGIAGGLAVMAGQFVLIKVRAFLDAINDQVRALLRRTDIFAAVFVAMAFTGYLLGTIDLGFHAVSAVANGPRVQVAGLGTNALIVLIVGAAAYAFARARAGLGDLFDLVPLSDERNVQRVLFFFEVAWTVLGLFVALLLPWVGLALMLSSLSALLAATTVLRRVTGGARGPCATCGASLHLAASTCSTCQSARSPQQLGVLGQVRDGAPADHARHRLSLLASRRCPSCAERLRGATACPACGQRPFADDDEARAFVKYVDARVAVLTPAFGALGLIPVLGLGAALVLYRLSPAGALNGFIGLGPTLATRAMRGLALFALALLQPLPLVGALAVLGLILVTQLWTRRAFFAARTDGVAALGQVAVPVPAA